MSGGETDFTIPFGYSDVVFNIEGRKVHANRAILAMSSPILENMFEDEGAEEITLDTPDHEGFLELMRVVHPPHKAIEGVYVIFLLLCQSHLERIPERSNDIS